MKMKEFFKNKTFLRLAGIMLVVLLIVMSACIGVNIGASRASSSHSGLEVDTTIHDGSKESLPPRYTCNGYYPIRNSFGCIVATILVRSETTAYIIIDDRVFDVYWNSDDIYAIRPMNDHEDRPEILYDIMGAIWNSYAPSGGVAWKSLNIQ